MTRDNATEDDQPEVKATRLEVSIYPAEDRSEGYVPEIDDEQIERAEELISDHGFHLAEDSYDVTILTTAFVTTQENLTAIEEIVSTLEEWYPENTVTHSEAINPNNTTGNIFEFTHMISVEDDAGDEEEEESPETEEQTEKTPPSERDDTNWRRVSTDVDWETDNDRISDWKDRISTDRSTPEEEVIVAFIDEPWRTEHEYYRIENAAEFFGDAWGDNTEMANKIHESDLEPFRTVSLPNADWIIPD